MSKIFSLRPSPGSAACSLRRSSFNWRTVLIEDIADGWLLILLHVASTSRLTFLAGSFYVGIGTKLGGGELS